MADIGTDAGLMREDSALLGASKIFTFLWNEAWSQAEATQAGDTDALHDMRVAFRRLRTALQNFEGDKDSPVLTKPLRRELKEWRSQIGKLGEHLGAVRDFDVLIDYVRKFDAEHTVGLDEFIETLAHERERHFATMIRKIARANAEEGIREQFARWSMGLPAARTKTPHSLAEIAHIILPDRLEEALALGAVLKDDDEEAHHELRKSLRRVRYTLEMLAPCFDKPVKKPIKHLVEMQDLLGEMQDRTVLSEWVHQSFKHAPDDIKTFAKHGDERHKELLHQVRELWNKREADGLWNNLKKLAPTQETSPSEMEK